MSSDRSEPLLRVPPFPGARVTSFARGSDKLELSDDQIDRLMADLKLLRVGGDYWEQQPDLPDGPYVLVATADAVQGKAVARRIADGAPVLCWNRGPCDPWHLMSRVNHAVVDADDEIGLIAAIAGAPVTSIGEGPLSALEHDRVDRGTSLRRLFRDAIGDADY